LPRHAGKVLGKVLAQGHGAAQGRGHSSTLCRAGCGQQSAGQGWVHGVGQGQVHIGFKPLKQRFGYTKARIVTGDSLPLYSFDKQALCRLIYSLAMGSPASQQHGSPVEIAIGTSIA
jgi:hypothetical protein